MEWHTLLNHLHLVPTKASLPPIVLVGVAVGVAVLALYPFTWRVMGYLITVIHEAGHALAGLLAGRGVRGITIRRDQSGETVTAGRGWLGQVWTTWWGYPTPALAGWGYLWAATTGWSGAALSLSLLTLMGVLLWSRSWVALGTVGGTLAVLGGVWWYGSTPIQVGTTDALGWVLVLGAFRSLLGVARTHLPGRGVARIHSDAAALARLTLLPSMFWLGTFLAVCCAALYWGVMESVALRL